MVAGLLFAQGAMADTTFSDFTSYYYPGPYYNSPTYVGRFYGGESYVLQTPDSVFLANSASTGFEYLPSLSSKDSSYSSWDNYGANHFGSGVYSSSYAVNLFGSEVDSSSYAVYQGNNLVVGGVYSLDGKTFNAVSSTETIGIIAESYYGWEAPEIDTNLAGLSIGLLSGLLFLSAERRRAAKI